MAEFLWNLNDDRVHPLEAAIVMTPAGTIVTRRSFDRGLVWMVVVGPCRTINNTKIDCPPIDYQTVRA